MLRNDCVFFRGRLISEDAPIEAGRKFGVRFSRNFLVGNKVGCAAAANVHTQLKGGRQSFFAKKKKLSPPPDLSETKIEKF